ncbi:hypothetical protein F2Q68_00008581 [Brassica cretica]|uniref:Uncharacterized protein n=1 Tax=Brassica cretica TaxID=69181 RepID=A0A8S9KYP5_BRACR|nr:hypothetical protein F2Q68_00008581 [Brassica cretica]
MLQGLRERKDPKTEVRTAAQMSVFKNSDTNKWSHSNGVTIKVVMAGYSGFATCKKLKLSGNKGCMLSLQKMIKVLVWVRLCVVLGDALEVEDGCWYFEASKSVQLRRFELQGCRFSHKEVKEQVLVVKSKLKG